jgi:TRAP-type mannitol/chloroaromatic compound transport system permease small subunit
MSALHALVNYIDAFTDRLGRWLAWLSLAMALVTALVVVLRYGFNMGSIAAQEAVTYMHGSLFMLGAAYALKSGAHVRVDIFYRDMSERRRAWVDLFGTLLFLLPLCAFLGYKSWDFVAVSWQLGESSREPGGMPYPFVPLLKSVLLVMPLLLGVQGTALLIRSLQAIRGRG